jgi:hypothetical protein
MRVDPIANAVLNSEFCEIPDVNDMLDPLAKFCQDAELAGAIGRRPHRA